MVSTCRVSVYCDSICKVMKKGGRSAGRETGANGASAAEVCTIGKVAHEGERDGLREGFVRTNVEIGVVAGESESPASTHVLFVRRELL